MVLPPDASFYVTGYAVTWDCVQKKPQLFCCGFNRYLHTGIADAVQQCAILAHHNEQVLFHKQNPPERVFS